MLQWEELKILIIFDIYSINWTNNSSHIILLFSNVKDSYPRLRSPRLRSCSCPLRTNQRTRSKGWMRNARHGNHQTQTWKPNWRTQDRKNIFYSRTPTTLKLKLNSSPSSTTFNQFTNHAESTRKLNQLSEMLLKLPVLVSFWPATASRMSEPSSWLLTASSKTHPALPTTSSSLSSFTSWADKVMLIAKSSSTSSSDDCIAFEH